MSEGFRRFLLRDFLCDLQEMWDTRHEVLPSRDQAEGALAAERARAEAAEAALAAEAVELDRAVEHVRALLSVVYGHTEDDAGHRLGVSEAAEAWLAEIDAGKGA
jgi:hypothetical protein